MLTPCPPAMKIFYSVMGSVSFYGAYELEVFCFVKYFSILILCHALLLSAFHFPRKCRGYLYVILKTKMGKVEMNINLNGYSNRKVSSCNETE